MKQNWILLLSFLFLWSSGKVYSQENDPVLFELGGLPVHVSEFLYIYNKNNGKEADFSRESLEEYLDLYVKFKMKVARARDLNLDTIQDLATELAGYRRQLANSYLTDKEVVERLSMELYERQKEDVNISHILVACDPAVSGADTLGYYQKAMAIYKELKNGAAFEDLARSVSEDEFSALQGGSLGFLTAKLPDGFYQVENAAYQTPVGDFSMPVRSKLGYHIIRVNEKRPARGEMEVAHILCRKARRGEQDAGAKARIDRIYQQLKDGGNFESLAKANSDDKNNSNNGGYIGFFGINQFESTFEEAAFALSEDGIYTEPVESSVGWHIIKRISKRPVLSFDKQRRKLQEEIKKDERFGLAEKAMIRRIKKQAGYQENKETIEGFVSKLDEDFYSINWKVPSDLGNGTVFNLGGEETDIREFADFVRSNTRTRLRLSKETPLDQAVAILFDEFVNSYCIRYEEANLEKNYPDFRALMREYEEGILLFEATKIHVWDKAARDTIGLENYFKSHRDKYRWEERAEIFQVVIRTDDPKLAEKIRSYANSKGVEKAVKKFNKKESIVSFTRKLAEKKARKDYEPLPFKADVSSELEATNGEFRYTMIERILPPAPKDMDEARGYIIADYQDELEKSWIVELKSGYPVKMNEKVFESLIQ